MRAPRGLKTGGRKLWSDVTEMHADLDLTQLVQLEEACRAKDRCDHIAAMLEVAYESKLVSDANTTANLMKQLLAALRLPDPKTGQRPQYRGPRGVQKPSVGTKKISSLDRARAAKGA